MAQLTDLAPDACPIVAYGALIPPAALAVPAHGWINLHFSLLPAWRGAAPVQHAIWHGDEYTGAATFQLEEGLDTGPIYGTVVESIGPHDTAGDLLGRLAVPVRDRHELDAGDLLQAGQVPLLGDPARADEPDPDPLAGHRSPPRSDTIADAGRRHRVGRRPGRRGLARQEYSQRG